MVVEKTWSNELTSTTVDRSVTLNDLIIKCLDNDRLAQSELYRMYHGKLLALCLRYFSNRDDAVSALNLGFLKIFRNLSKFKKSEDFGAWSYRIVQNTAIDQFRSQTRYDNNVVVDEKPEDTGLNPDVVSKLYAEDLIVLLQKLPPTTRMVFNLFAIEAWTHAEIAERLEISEGTSKWHVNNARKMLKQWIEKQ
ncbi:MAG: RNA polymerase sigma factor [Flavobacteriales bacterium]|nr:RNA polymerase sigma factor [Flavobacteriales bacterium]